MSLAATSAVWEHSRQTGTRLTVLLAIADRADGEGFAWPAVADVAERSRISERQTRRIISELIEAGEVDCTDRAGGRSRSSRYRITLVNPDTKADINPDTYDRVNGETRTPRVVKADIAVSPERLEPKEQLSARTIAVHAILSTIDKDGYQLPKFTAERLEPIVTRYPTLDVVAEAEQVADWERFGKGERRKRDDGVAFFRNWLAKASSTLTMTVIEHEADYPWIPGEEPL